MYNDIQNNFKIKFNNIHRTVGADLPRTCATVFRRSMTSLLKFTVKLNILLFNFYIRNVTQ